MAMLEVRDLFTGYGDTEVLHGVSIALEAQEVITIIGPNGAGKSTLLKAIMGYLPARRGAIRFCDQDVTSLPPEGKVKRGIGYVPQLDNVFPSLTVQENLEMGGYLAPRPTVQQRLSRIYQLFPILADKRHQRVRTMSGGQRQMLAMGRALMADPRLLLLDEPSAGLAPKVSTAVFAKIEEIHQEGTAIMIVEQDAYQALGISHRGYVLTMGQNEFTDEAQQLLRDARIRAAYLGG